jgi:hypothetical protein
LVGLDLQIERLPHGETEFHEDDVGLNRHRIVRDAAEDGSKGA